MVNIQFAAAKIRRGKEKEEGRKKKKDGNHRAKI